MTSADPSDSTPRPAPSVSLSVIVPVFNEQDSLHQLIDELQASVKPTVSTCEIILIDDGSTDKSWNTIQLLSAGCQRVRNSPASQLR